MMLEGLGRIEGKTTTYSFSFYAQAGIQKFDYVSLDMDSQGVKGNIIAQISELTHLGENMKADCDVFGIVTDNGLSPLRIPPKPGLTVYGAKEDTLRKAISIIKKGQTTAFLGKIQRTNISVYSDLQTMLSKHIAVLAKTGAGKSYTVGVLLEEVMDSKIPLVVIDPHGEYSSMKYPNDNEDDKKRLDELKLKAKSYARNILEYSATSAAGTRPLKIKDAFTPSEIIKILPSKISSAQKALLYSVMKDMPFVGISQVIEAMEAVENQQKYSLIGLLEAVRDTGVFDVQGITAQELVMSGKACIINLKGVNPDVQQIIVYKLLKDLFHARKIGSIAPHLLVLEEAHNFCPERGFGEVKSSEVVRLIASEGRKFGMGLCIVSQRPARVDKSVLSQVNSQIILKVTNPHDLKAISGSVEGISSSTEKELPNLQIGTAILTGVTDMPLIIDIRARKSRHGGTAQQITQKDEIKAQETETLPVIRRPLNPEEYKGKGTIRKISTFLIPAVLLLVEQDAEEALILIEQLQGRIITDMAKGKSARIFLKEELNSHEAKVMSLIWDKSSFDINDLAKHESMFVIGESLSSLIRKGILYYDGMYKKKDDAVYEKLCDYGSYYELQTETVQYDKKLEKAVSLSEITKKVQKIAKIIESKECYILHHEPEFA
jgi:uncharacterized protein